MFSIKNVTFSSLRTPSIKYKKMFTRPSSNKHENAIHLLAYAENVIVFISRQSNMQVVMKLLDDFKALSSARINWNKRKALLLGWWTEGKPSLPYGLTWQRGDFKYLGVFVGDEVTVQRNLEGAVEKVKGPLEKWKWLTLEMSYRGRTLVSNNLIASCFWHKLACVEPPWWTSSGTSCTGCPRVCFTYPMRWVGTDTPAKQDGRLLSTVPTKNSQRLNNLQLAVSRMCHTAQRWRTGEGQESFLDGPWEAGQ